MSTAKHIIVGTRVRLGMYIGEVTAISKVSGSPLYTVRFTDKFLIRAERRIQRKLTKEIELKNLENRLLEPIKTWSINNG